MEKVVKDRKEDFERLRNGDYRLWLFLTGMLKIDPMERLSPSQVIDFDFDG